MTLSEKVKYVRAKLRLTQKELSRKPVYLKIQLLNGKPNKQQNHKCLIMENLLIFVKIME